jgi:rhodanese-related sulfurtransferase
LEYRDRVRQRLIGLYDIGPLSQKIKRAMWLGYEHEVMHIETLLYMLIQSPKTRPPPYVPTPDWQALATRAPRLAIPDRNPATMFVDVRDPRELEHEGVIPGAVHAPRGMMEFRVDPESPYYRQVFGDEAKTYVLFCALGWRSTLTAATLTDMGMTNVCDIEGGIAGWKLAGGSVVPKPRKTAPPK